MICIDGHDVLVARYRPVRTNGLHVCRTLVSHPCLFAIVQRILISEALEDRPHFLRRPEMRIRRIKFGEWSVKSSVVAG